MDKVQFDWMMVQIRGYNEEKGYIYGSRYPDGKEITIARKKSNGRNYYDSMTNKSASTYTPIGSVVAVYSIEKPRPDREFYLAGWATPVSKDLAQEDVYVTPIKVSSRPLTTKPDRNGKTIAATATVLDSNAISVKNIDKFQDACITALNDNTKTSLPIGGMRGFMVRIGVTDGDDKSQCISYNFNGKNGISPERVWQFHLNQPPKNGRQKNILRTVGSHAKACLEQPNGFVEIVGYTTAIINDYGKTELSLIHI